MAPRLQRSGDSLQLLKLPPTRLAGSADSRSSGEVACCRVSCIHATACTNPALDATSKSPHMPARTATAGASDEAARDGHACQQHLSRRHNLRKHAPEATMAGAWERWRYTDTAAFGISLFRDLAMPGKRHVCEAPGRATRSTFGLQGSFPASARTCPRSGWIPVGGVRGRRRDTGEWGNV